VWLEPRAVVVYKKAQPAQAEDIVYFMARRGDELCYGSQLHLNTKWGITYVTDRWHEKHRDEQFSGTVLRAVDVGGSTAADRIVPVRGMTGGAHEVRQTVQPGYHSP
jgi:3,4-dihydroxy-2-butanone 4-phosphate synthase